jgi:hypothetical protein
LQRITLQNPAIRFFFSIFRHLALSGLLW